MSIKIFDLEFETESLPVFSETIIQKIGENKKFKILPVTMHEILLTKKDIGLKNSLHSFQFLTTDGMPLVWLAKLKGFKNASRIYGPELIEEIFYTGQQKGITHFLYGNTEKVLEKLQKNLKQRYPKALIVGSYAPPFRALTDQERQTIINMINTAQPHIVWVSLGGEKQIYWIDEFFPLINSTCIAVGAAFDFLSGNKPQAPKWIRNNGFEWLFRLVTEPKRLWERYLLYFPSYVYLFVRELMRSYEVEKTT